MSAELFHIESEQSVIGSLLIDPKCHERIDFLTEADFYREDHRIIWRNISMLLAERKPVDVVTVAESLLSGGVSEDRIGLAYLGELAHNTPTSASVVRYAEVVRNKRMLRDLLFASNAIADLAQGDNSMPAEQRIDEAEAIMFKLSENATARDSEPRLIGSVLCSVVEDIQERFDRGGQIVGLPTGFADLDSRTCGLQGGDLIVVAGRPSMGKTAFALNIAENVAFEQNKTALVFSMEMGEKQLTERSIASVGAIPLLTGNENSTMGEC